MMPERRTVMAYVGDLMRGEWNYINTITAPPASGQLRLNNTAQQSATLMWVHKTTANAIDRTRGNGTVPQQRVIFVILPGSQTADYAYPSTSPAGTHLGLTTEQYYATQAMIGFIGAGVAENLVYGQLAEWSFTVAKSMAAQEKRVAKGESRPPAGTPKKRAIGRQTARPVLP
jgi:hypothetical protein